MLAASPSRSRRTQARWLLRLLFHALLVLAVIASGSVDEVALHVVAVGFLGVATVAAAISGPDEKVRSIYHIALAVALALGLWIIIQASSFAGNPFANPIWTDAAGIHGSMAGSISVSPGDTLEGLIAALLPFAIFLAALLLFRSDAEALGLIRVIVISGTAICAFGLLQFLFAPDMLFLAPKQFYLDSLTTVFVNRNTAATYIAMIMIFAAGLAFHSLQAGGVRGLIGFLINAPGPTTKPDAVRAMLYGAASALALICLMLTQSRAGIGSALCGLFLMAAILVIPGRSSGFAGGRHGHAAPRRMLPQVRARTVLLFAAIVSIGLLFAGQAILRAGAQGATDLRFCFLPSLIDMTRDNWIVGTGFGTFRDVFPAYRNPACGMDGILVRAHNFYLEGWITLGLPFVAASLLVIVSLFVILIRGVRNRRQYRWLPAAGLGVLVLQVTRNSVDFSIQNPGVAAVFSAIAAASIIVARGRQPKPRMQAFSAAPTGIDPVAPVDLG
jgi:hypothetical protein